MEEQLTNRGKAWLDDEILQLLQNIRKKKTIAAIAAEHRRTMGSITSRLRVLAADYHNEGRSIEEIMKFTGLTKFEVNNAIEGRRISEENHSLRKKKGADKAYSFIEAEPTMKDLMVVLKDIQAKLTLLTAPAAPPDNP